MRRLIKAWRNHLEHLQACHRQEFRRSSQASILGSRLQDSSATLNGVMLEALASDSFGRGTMAKVRKWTWNDFPQVCEMARLASQSYGELNSKLAHYFPPNPGHMYEHVMMLFRDRIGWVVIQDDKVVGVLALDTAHQPWNMGKSYLINSHFWIEPTCRQAGVAAELLEQAQLFADEMKTPLKFEMTMGLEKPEKIDRFMRMKGFRHTGGEHWYVPPLHREATAEEIGEAA